MPTFGQRDRYWATLQVVHLDFFSNQVLIAGEVLDPLINNLIPKNCPPASAISTYLAVSTGLPPESTGWEISTPLTVCGATDASRELESHTREQLAQFHFEQLWYHHKPRFQSSLRSSATKLAIPGWRLNLDRRLLASCSICSSSEPKPRLTKA